MERETRDLGQALAGSIAAAGVGLATFDGLGFPMFSGLFFLLLGCIGALWRCSIPLPSERRGLHRRRARVDGRRGEGVTSTGLRRGPVGVRLHLGPAPALPPGRAPRGTCVTRWRAHVDVRDVGHPGPAAGPGGLPRWLGADVAPQPGLGALLRAPAAPRGRTRRLRRRARDPGPGAPGRALLRDAGPLLRRTARALRRPRRHALPGPGPRRRSGADATGSCASMPRPPG